MNKRLEEIGNRVNSHTLSKNAVFNLGKEKGILELEVNVLEATKSELKGISKISKSVTRNINDLSKDRSNLSIEEKLKNIKSKEIKGKEIKSKVPVHNKPHEIGL